MKHDNHKEPETTSQDKSKEDLKMLLSSLELACLMLISDIRNYRENNNLNGD